VRSRSEHGGITELTLVDVDSEIVHAWEAAFKPFPEVSIHHGDLLSVAHGTVVSPSNGYGFMDGGIDASYMRYFGSGIEDTVRVPSPDDRKVTCRSGRASSWRRGTPTSLISPTMLMPEAIPSSHCYRAMRAILRVASQTHCDAVFCPDGCGQSFTGDCHTGNGIRLQGLEIRDEIINPDSSWSQEFRN
jgi:hypothetical protein